MAAKTQSFIPLFLFALFALLAAPVAGPLATEPLVAG
jgi:hypothetical protein